MSNLAPIGLATTPEEKPRLRALLLSFEFGERISGGLGRVINGVTEELRHQVDLDVYLVYFDALRLGFSAKLFRCDPQHRAELVRTFTRGSAFRNCVELLRRERYSLLHVFAVHSSLQELLVLLERELPDLKIVYSVHSLVKFEQGIRLNPRSFLACEQRLLGLASMVHVLNRATLSCFQQAYPELASEKRTFIIPNAIESRDLSARDASFDAELRKKLTPDKYTVVETVKTRPGSKTMGALKEAFLHSPINGVPDLSRMFHFPTAG